MTWLVFLAAQVVLCLYLIQRTAPAEPRRLRVVVVLGVSALFALFNLPWLLWLVQGSRGYSMWRLSRQPWALPVLAWQFLSILYLFGVGGRALVSPIARAARRLWSAHGAGAAHAAADADPATRGVSRREFVRRSLWLGGYVAAGAGFVTLAVRQADGAPVVRETEIFFEDLPAAFDGYRILQVTDVHAGWNMGEDRMSRIADLAMQIGAELVAVTGDLIDWSLRDVPPYVRAFARVRAPDGVVCVLGNHDYYAGVAEVMEGIRRAGHGLLRNEHRVIARGAARLVLAGIDDPRRYGRPFGARDPQAADVRAALRGAPDGFRIALAHRPDAFVGASDAGVSLTLAGHTHGGQLALPGWSLARLATPFDRGHFSRGGRRLYVCPGLGVVGLPVRIGVPPELALIRLRAGADARSTPPPTA